MNSITTQEAAKMIRGSNGKIFSATVIKRTTGSLRRMTGRLAVTPKTPSEAGANYNAKDHDLIRVSEFVTAEHTERNAKGQFTGKGNMKVQYRALAIEGIRSLKIGGKSFAVTQ
jgi:hypothetical protein